MYVLVSGLCFGVVLCRGSPETENVVKQGPFGLYPLRWNTVVMAQVLQVCVCKVFIMLLSKPRVLLLLTSLLTVVAP
jgi:hypothetical protein